LIRQARIAEPIPPQVKEEAAVQRFVILEHDHPQLHWDLMLETGGVLRTWRLLAPPEEGCAVAAEASFDHRLAYLDYEGPVSGNRGHVRRWDHGTYQIEDEQTDRLCLLMDGQRLHGRVVLENSPDGWRFSRR
jgi:hypothetical protein